MIIDEQSPRRRRRGIDILCLDLGVSQVNVSRGSECYFIIAYQCATAEIDIAIVCGYFYFIFAL